MYAQYQQYQQPQAGSSASHYWDGSTWLSTAMASSVLHPGTYPAYNSTVTATPTATQAAAAPAAVQSNRVTTYTEYYHGWQAHVKEQEALVSKLPIGSTARDEAQRHVEWGRYYSDESSRAAHYFHENPTSTSPPFELPPAPPNAHRQGDGQNVAATQSAAVTPAPQAARQQQQQNNDPSGLKRYVQNCLNQCTSQHQKREMQSEVEKIIAMALQDGTYHSKNWDAEPLLRLAGFGHPHQPVGFKLLPQPKPNRSQNGFQGRNGTKSTPGRSTLGNPFSSENDGTSTNNDGYYGPSAGGSGTIRTKAEQKLPSNDSYYGPAGGNMSNTSHPNGQFGRRASNQSENSHGLNKRQNTFSPSSSFHNPNLPFEKGVSPFQSQQRKRRSLAASDENFISLNKQQPPQKKQRVPPNMTGKGGFELSSSTLAKRANRFNGPGGIEDASSVSTTLDGSDRYMGKRLIGGSQKTLNEEDFEKMTVKGTCMTLEKEYLRLTAPPRAELVRPQPVLERHLENLKAERALKQRRHDYLWFCSQLKAVRQDCTVQRIQNAFGVDVYETHAKIALEEGDLNEYNQCQTQLKELYEMHGSSSEASRNLEEFIAYRLLYYVFLSTNETYDGGSSDLFKIMLSLTPDQSRHPSIAHACKVREAVALGDFLGFFRLHDASPNLGRYLTTRIVPTMRYRALQRIAKAYRPSVETKFCLRQLGFKESSSQTKEGIQYLESCGCVLEGDEFIAKDTVVHEPQEDKKNSLI